MSGAEARFFPPGERVGVLTTEPVGMLDYLAPEGGVRAGQLVMVPLGPRQVMGCVWGAGDGGFDAAKKKLTDAGYIALGAGAGAPARRPGTRFHPHSGGRPA